MKETFQQTLVRRLAKYKGQHARIARETKIAQATISRISNAMSMPRIDIAQSLFDWMDREEANELRKARELVRKANVKTSAVKAAAPAV